MLGKPINGGTGDINYPYKRVLTTQNKTIYQGVHTTYFNRLQGQDSPSSTIIVFSTSRAFHWKVTNRKLR